MVKAFTQADEHEEPACADELRFPLGDEVMKLHRC